MGARPIALLNSLRFGRPDSARNRYLYGGVVAGISEYGNCIGIPNVGGEVVFSDSYSDNPLVNAMCVGIVPADKLLSATTGAPGNLLMLVGADTGRDGIHGASGLASRSFEDDRDLRPAVQVGNPFLEKVLIGGVPGAGRFRAARRPAGPGRGGAVHGFGRNGRQGWDGPPHRRVEGRQA